MKKVLVIGSESFIGKHLVSELIETKNVKLSVLYRKTSKERTQFFTENNIKYYVGDLEDYNALRQLESDYDMVYYLISATYPAVSWSNPKIEVAKNLTPFFNFMRFVAAKNIKRLAYISSGGTVYGKQSGSLDEQKLTQPFSPYGIFKLTMESLLEYMRVKENVEYDVYRISNIYGPGQNISKGLGVINIWLDKIIKEKKVTVFGDGENVRDYIYVKDVAKLLTLSLHRNGLPSEIYNMGSNIGYSLNDLLSVIKEVVPYEFKIDYIDSRKSDNKHVVLDSAKIVAHFKGFEFIPIKEGIELTFQSYKNSVIS